METVPGYKATSWAAGYGDYVMRPDLSTLRRIPWLEGTALVLADVLDHHGHAEVPHAPRAILRRQVARLAALGYRPMMASELEFFLFEQSYREAHAAGYRGLTPISPYNEDYHIFQTTKEEEVMRAIRTGLNAAGIPVESSKGEASAGQEEINVSYDEAVAAADAHVVVKNGAKEVAGRRATRSPSWPSTTSRPPAPPATSTSRCAFPTARRRSTTPARARHVGGDAQLPRRPARPRRGGHLLPRPERQQLQALRRRHLRSDDGDLVDRQPHRRLPPRRGADTQSVRIECRVGGADLNPYLAFAAQLAAGAGVEAGLELERSSEATPTAPPGCARSRRPFAPPPRRCAARPCCAPPSATRSSTTMSTPPAGSSPSTTASSPTGRSPAASSA